ncbi:cytochrome P450 monooxygenase [Penicillium canescens]|nr:cytochrome P450 monooxygenase [Penicillium canescens]
MFAIVTPAGCELYIADSKAASEILMRKKDFPKPLDFTILLKACLGLDNDDNNAAASPVTDTAMKQLENFFKMILRNPEFRKGGQRSRDAFHASYQEIKSVLTGLVNYRRRHPSTKNDLLSSMLSLHDAQMLSDEEIESNLFLFMFAGHETTANTLVYIVYLLAIFPDWQNWVIQEIDEIFSGIPLDKEISYKDVFNRLTRLKAIMYETLRLYGPVVNLLRRTSPDQDQAITSSGGSGILIPASTLINILTPALHTNRDYWGSDALSWKPDRWLSKKSLDSEKVDHLFAWAEGPRACPGRKFSQLEILAVIVTLLRQTSVQIVPRPGISLEEAKIEALGVLQNSRSLLTLHIERPELIHIRWCPR